MSTLASPGSSRRADRARAVLLVLALVGLAGCPATVRTHEGVTIADAPREAIPDGTAVSLTVQLGSNACGGGSLVSAKVMVGEQVVAEVAPASEQVVQVPIGRVRVVAGALSADVEVGKSGGRVVIGCDEASFRGAPLLPLTLVAPDARCTALPELHVKAAGIARTLAPGERWTLLVPRGGYVVRFGVGADLGRAVSLTIGESGKELALAPGCLLLESVSPASALAP